MILCAGNSSYTFREIRLTVADNAIKRTQVPLSKVRQRIKPSSTKRTGVTRVHELNHGDFPLQASGRVGI